MVWVENVPGLKTKKFSQFLMELLEAEECHKSQNSDTIEPLLDADCYLDYAFQFEAAL